MYEIRWMGGGSSGPLQVWRAQGARLRNNSPCAADVMVGTLSVMAAGLELTRVPPRSFPVPASMELEAGVGADGRPGLRLASATAGVPGLPPAALEAVELWRDGQYAGSITSGRYGVMLLPIFTDIQFRFDGTPV